eukprot:jgi/Botrbrau1/20153/Bobra.0173s0055.2
MEIKSRGTKGPLSKDDKNTESLEGAHKRKREEQKDAKRQRRAIRQKFERGGPVATKIITDKKLKGKMRYMERLVEEAVSSAAHANEWLLPLEAGTLEAEGIERTANFSQVDMVAEVEIGAARKVFDLSLTELGPYSLDFTRSGRYMAIAGRKGHLALMEWQKGRLISEVQVREVTRDVKFLHNEMFYAAAQKKYVYIYDKRGLEVHCLKDALSVRRMEFLPYHFLLATIGDPGVLRYQDTSTGHVVANYRTGMGPCHVMRQNPWNAVVCTGHNNGVVGMWIPNMGQPVVKMLCHQGPLRALGCDNSGRYMASAGTDGRVNIWDIRMYKQLHMYSSQAPAYCLDISQRGLLAVGYGRHVEVWKDALVNKQKAPYLRHFLSNGILQDFHFCPFEDVGGIGHSGGVSTMLIPGAGEPNYDSFVADPFQSYKARREQEVAQLLDKLPPESITIDPSSVGKVLAPPSFFPRRSNSQQRTKRDAA